jgi:hypothetical protein
MKSIKNFEQFEIKDLNLVKGGVITYTQYGDHYDIHDCHEGHNGVPGEIHCVFMGSFSGAIC